MSSGRRSTAIDSGVVKTLTGLTDDNITQLRDTYTLTTIDELALLDKADLDTMFGNDASTFLRQ